MEHSLEANVLKSKLRSGETKLKKYFSPFDVCLPPGFLFSHRLLLHSQMNFSLTVNVERSLCNVDDSLYNLPFKSQWKTRRMG